MQDLSSVAKGDIFEHKVFKLFKSHVLSGEYTLNPNKCQFFMQKGYYSYKRKKDIKVDMSIEVHAKDKNKISLLVVIECKNYNKRVGVDDIEEFESKLSQISGKNVKGIVFTTLGFQSGALEFAASSGIALARFLPDNQINWFLERSQTPLNQHSTKLNKDKEIETALTEEDFQGQAEFLFSTLQGRFSANFREIFNQLIPNEFKTFNRSFLEESYAEVIPFIGQDYIDQRVDKVFKFFGNKVKQQNEILLLPICEYLSENKNINFIFNEYLGQNSSAKDILGKFDLDSNSIFISNSLEHHSPRWRFTLAHELGHFLLHRKLFTKNPEVNLMDSSESIDLENVGKSDAMRLEWQANSFASSLLMPRLKLIQFIAKLLIRYEVRTSNHAVIYLDNQRNNIITFRKIATHIAKEFNVSITMVTYRLMQLNILNNHSKYRGAKAVSSLVKDI